MFVLYFDWIPRAGKSSTITTVNDVVMTIGRKESCVAI